MTARGKSALNGELEEYWRENREPGKEVRAPGGIGSDRSPLALAGWVASRFGVN